jgi:hypothetical protein
MKRFFLTTALAGFLLIFSNGIQAQTVTNNLDQLKLMQQYLGTWQANTGKDTVEVWEFQQYGKAFTINVSQIVNGKKTPMEINNLGFDSKEGKFKGYALWYNGGYTTWIGLFSSDKKFSGEMMQDFKSETTFIKFESVSVNLKEWDWTQFNATGTKILEYKFMKVK